MKRFNALTMTLILFSVIHASADAPFCGKVFTTDWRERVRAQPALGVPYGKSYRQSLLNLGLSTDTVDAIGSKGSWRFTTQTITSSGKSYVEVGPESSTAGNNPYYSNPNIKALPRPNQFQEILVNGGTNSLWGTTDKYQHGELVLLRSSDGAEIRSFRNPLTEKGKLRGRGAYNAGFFSEDGKYIIGLFDSNSIEFTSAKNTTGIVWDADTGEVVSTLDRKIWFHGDDIRPRDLALGFDIKGDLLVTIHWSSEYRTWDNTFNKTAVVLWNIKTGKVLKTFNLKRLKGQTHNVSIINDGKQIEFGNPEKGPVSILDVN